MTNQREGGEAYLHACLPQRSDGVPSSRSLVSIKKTRTNHGAYKIEYVIEISFRKEKDRNASDRHVQDFMDSPSRERVRSSNQSAAADQFLQQAQRSGSSDVSCRQ